MELKRNWSASRAHTLSSNVWRDIWTFLCYLFDVMSTRVSFGQAGGFGFNNPQRKNVFPSLWPGSQWDSWSAQMAVSSVSLRPFKVNTILSLVKPSWPSFPAGIRAKVILNGRICIFMEHGRKLHDANVQNPSNDKRGCSDLMFPLPPFTLSAKCVQYTSPVNTLPTSDHVILPPP